MGTRATLGTMARKWQYSVKRISTSDSVIRGVSTNYWIFDSNLNSGSLYKLYAGTNRKRKYLYRTLSELLLYLVIALLSRKYKLEFTASWLIYFYLFTSMTCHMTQKIRQQSWAIISALATRSYFIAFTTFPVWVTLTSIKRKIIIWFCR